MTKLGFLEQTYQQLLSSTKHNPYLRKMVLVDSNPEAIDAFLCGREINPLTREFIASAREEVLLQFSSYEAGSQAAFDIMDGLIELNKKTGDDSLIEIKFLLDKRSGPEWLIGKTYCDIEWLQSDENGNFVIDRDNAKHYLSKLNIQFKLHDHYASNSYHTNQLIVDAKRLMIRSGDPSKNSNTGISDGIDYGEGWTQVATIIENKTLAEEAAKSFKARWEKRFSTTQTYINNSQTNNSDKIMLLEKNPSSSYLKSALFNSPFKSILMSGINNASHSIRFMAADINDQEILDALIKAASNHVIIELIIERNQFSAGEEHDPMNEANKSIKYLYNHLPFQFWDKLNIRYACESQSDHHQKKMVDRNSHERMYANLVIIDELHTYTGSSFLDIHYAKNYGESDVVIESAKIAKLYHREIFNPLFQRGFNANRDLLVTLKQLLVNDIREYTLPDENSVLNMNIHEDLSEKKIMALRKLINSIKSCKNFYTLNAIFQDNLIIDADNPLAQIQKNSSFTLFDAGYGKTSTIKSLEKIYSDLTKNHFYERDMYQINNERSREQVSRTRFAIF